MALSRKFLSAMGIEADKVDEIITAHAETVNALKEERDTARKEAEDNKAAAEKLPEVEKELDALKAKAAEEAENGFEKKYKDLKTEYDKYKADTEAKETAAKKQAAYRALLKDAGVSEKRIDSVMKVTDLSNIELAEDGKVKDADKKADDIKKEWADFIQTEGEQGVNPATPPGNNGGGEEKPSLAAQRILKQRESIYGKAKEE